MSVVEWDAMVSYCTLRKYLIEKYPQSQQDAKTMGQASDEEQDELYQININKASIDPKSKLYWQSVLKMAAIFDKVNVLQTQATEYEKICLRIYWHLTYNWTMPQTSMFLGTILRIVTATYSRQWKPILKSAENTMFQPMSSHTTSYRTSGSAT
jgi:hypothetical protein